ncbi:MAG: hypothetical protein EOO60_10915 [Hymenobacter sp.]|nr:MAG: hypothetical protein EOO60_10915 [Hymenobacter sp.]
MIRLFLAATVQTMNSKPFLIIGVATVSLSYAYNIWQHRLKEERRAGVVSNKTNLLGRLVIGGFVLVTLLIIGVVGWMNRSN